MNLHENKDKFLENYRGDFEMNGSIMFGEIEHQINIRFKNTNEFESYLRAIGVDYDNEDVRFTGWLYKLNTHEFNKVNRSQYRRGRDFKQDIVEYICNSCYIPTSGNCFAKGVIHITGKDYSDLLTFIRTEQKGSIVMTTARLQSFCKNHSIIIGCYDALRVCPRNITEGNIVL